MVEVRTTIPAFKRIVTKTGNAVFESKGIVATALNGMFVTAIKINHDRLFPDSFPLKKLGYSGISSFEYGGRLLDDFEEEMRDLVKSLDNEQKKVLKSLLE